MPAAVAATTTHVIMTIVLCPKLNHVPTVTGLLFGLLANSLRGHQVDGADVVGVEGMAEAE